MKRMTMFVAAVLFAAAACSMAKMDMDTLQISNVTTSTTPTSVSGAQESGTIEMVNIDVSASANMDIDIVDAAGQTVYSADDVTADVTFRPIYSTAGINSAGGAVTNPAKIAFIGPLTLYAGDEATTNKNRNNFV